MFDQHTQSHKHIVCSNDVESKRTNERWICWHQRLYESDGFLEAQNKGEREEEKRIFILSKYIYISNSKQNLAATIHNNANNNEKRIHTFEKQQHHLNVVLHIFNSNMICQNRCKFCPYGFTSTRFVIFANILGDFILC